MRQAQLHPSAVSFPRHMPSLVRNSYALDMDHIVRLEAQLRDCLVTEEVSARSTLRCNHVRFRRPQSASLVVLSASGHCAAENLSLSGALAASESDSASRQLTPHAAWELRRSSAAARRKKSSSLYSDVVDRSTQRGTSSSVAPPPQPSGAADLDEHATEVDFRVRCLRVEAASLPHQYRTLWVETFDAHKAMIRSVAEAWAPIWRSSRALRIQTSFRMFRCRSAYQTLYRAIVLIQGCGRALALRREFPGFRRAVRASWLLARCCAGYRVRRLVAREHAPRVAIMRANRAATKIQSAYRGYVAAGAYWKWKRNTRAARLIQRVTREFLRRRDLQRKELDFNATVARLMRRQSLTDLKLTQSSFRNSIEAWEQLARTELVDVAVVQGTAIARCLVALRRLHEPHGDSQRHAAGLLAPSAVGKSEDRLTLRFSSVFDAHLMQLKNARPTSSAARRHAAAVSAATSAWKARCRLGLLYVEANEAIVRQEISLQQFLSAQFIMERIFESKTLALTSF